MLVGQRIRVILLSTVIATTHISHQHLQQDGKLIGATNKHVASSSGSGVAGFLLAEGSDNKLNQSDAIDALLMNLLARVGPDMRPMRNFKDFADIKPEVARRAWILMHDHAQLAIVDRMQFMEPIIGDLLRQANVSELCSTAAISTIEAAKQLDSWAIQLLASWGNFPPVGFYEGTFSDIGSYHGCLNVPENRVIGHAHYCSVSYRPVLATRPNYELIIRQEPDELLHLFDRAQEGKVDAFTDLLAAAQYHHYVYYKLGTCFPIDCSPLDVQKLAKLIGRRSILMSGPVKCHSKYKQDYQDGTNGSSSGLIISTRDVNGGVYIWKPHITRTQIISLAIVASISLFIAIMTIIDVIVNILPKKDQLIGPNLSKTIALEHRSNVDQKRLESSLDLKFTENLHIDSNNNNVLDLTNISPLFDGNKAPDDGISLGGSATTTSREPKAISETLLVSIAKDFSVINNLNQFVQIDQSQTNNEISCINGIRCITMSWIVITHTVQYNDWSAFARTREVEVLLQSLINQPLFNGSYLVDTFFLVSGLLTSYSTFGRFFRSKRPTETRRAQGERLAASFSPCSYLLGRYLRLTPQIVFVSLLFILLPLMTHSGGPHWYTITGEYSENCSQNWWVNLFHIQAFYRSNEMCNFVGWWISVDMFYHLFALAVILLILHLGDRMALLSCAILTLGHGVIQAGRHYRLGLPPNLLSTIPQTGAMWSQMTLEFFWTPYAHALPYFFGFYLGYLMARDRPKMAAWFSPRRALVGWTLALVSLALQSYSTYFWVIGRWRYTALQSTSFHLISAGVWSACLAWIIVACHFGHGGPINQLLSCRLFLVLGKASYVVYLSHFLVLFAFFGGQNLLLEPTRLTMLYVIVGNVCFAMLLGSLLSVVYEMPWLKVQRRIMSRIR